jgi:hypothetical protein
MERVWETVVAKFMARSSKKPAEIYELNRRLFIKWSQGILLERDREGKCVVLDGSDFSKRCEEATEALERGALLYLTDDHGKRITQITSDGKSYEEDRVGSDEVP